MMGNPARIDVDTRTCAMCGMPKSLDHFDPRFIHKGTKVTCAECRQARDAKEMAAREAQREEDRRREDIANMHYMAAFFLRHNQARAWMRPDEPSSICALADPRTGRMYYVGRTQDLRRRFNGHTRSRPATSKSSSADLTLTLLRAGLKPEMLLLETIYPCCSMSDEPYEWDDDPARTAYDLYVSERETRRMLWACVQGHRILNHCPMTGAPLATIVASVNTDGVDFLTVARSHPVWRELRDARWEALRQADKRSPTAHHDPQ